MTDYPTIALPAGPDYSPEEMRERIASFYAEVNRRRTVRDYADRPVPRDVIETAILAAGTAPSGANLQPWHFVVVSDADTRHRIRMLSHAAR